MPDIAHFTMYALTVLAAYSLAESYQSLRTMRGRCEQVRHMPVDDATGLLTTSALEPLLEVEFNRARRLDHGLVLSLLRSEDLGGSLLGTDLAGTTEFPDMAFRLADDLFLVARVASGDSANAAALQHGSLVATAAFPDDGAAVPDVLDALRWRIQAGGAHAA